MYYVTAVTIFFGNFVASDEINFLGMQVVPSVMQNGVNIEVIIFTQSLYTICNSFFGKIEGFRTSHIDYKKQSFKLGYV